LGKKVKQTGGRRGKDGPRRGGREKISLWLGGSSRKNKKKEVVNALVQKNEKKSSVPS